MTNQRSRSYWIGLSAQFVLVLLYCGWALSMPLFPSQDGPLHLYCVEVFRQLLAHHPGIYSQTYFIHRYVPPYSLYYYGLVLLGKVVSLEMADKLIVCGYFILLPLGLRSLVKVVGGSANWAPLLFMPVLLSWPLMMGFVNYCIATGFACFALAVWCRDADRFGWRTRVQFLFWILLILLTHPVPWMLVLAFCSFELVLRLLRSWRDGGSERGTLDNFAAKVLTLAVAGLGYFYLRHFQTPLPPNDHFGKLGLIAQTIYNLHDYVRLHGLALYTGMRTIAGPYRVGLVLVFFGALLLAILSVRSRRSYWSLSSVWLVFALIFLVSLPFIPGDINGSFYFAWRLLFLIYLSAVVASASAVERGGGLRVAVLVCAVITSLLNVWLAVRVITPEARLIASLRDAPVVQPGKPGLSMWMAGASKPDTLTFNPDEWAAANYFREHNLVLYNISWIYVNIIPIKPRPERLQDLDYTYEIRVPQPGGPLMQTPDEARYLLSRVGFVLAMRINTPPLQNPFAVTPGSSTPAAWAAGWSCLPTRAWALCTPPGEPLPAGSSAVAKIPDGLRSGVQRSSVN